MKRVSSVGIACVCMVAVAGSAMAIDTMVAATAVGSKSSLFKDYNGDGIVTDSDILLGLHAQLGGGSDGDVDGDGQITAADALYAVDKALRSSFGDTNGDGNIDDADIVKIAEVIAQASQEAGKDPNADGVTDAYDLLYVLEKVADAETPNGIWGGDVSTITALFVQLRAEGVNAYYISQDDTPNHHRATSEGWTLPPLHETDASHGVWPDNHFKHLSVKWPDALNPPDGDPWLKHYKERSKQWPPNHTVRISSGWDRPADHDWQLSAERPPGHDQQVSLDRTYHDDFYSKLWQRTPNHHRLVSLLWDPDGSSPDVSHVLDMSRRWPTDHQSYQSTLMPRVLPVDHSRDISMSWCCNGPAECDDDPALRDCDWTIPERLQHGIERSRAWPPSHHGTSSTSWQPHDARYSMVWPPNHTGEVSLTWPREMLPGTWPPNHLKATSDEYLTPDPPPAVWPLFPANHDWFTTISDGLNIPLPSVPGLRLPKPRPVQP